MFCFFCTTDGRIVPRTDLPGGDLPNSAKPPRTELVEPTDCDDDDDDDDDLFAPQATFINTLPGSSRSKHPFYCPQSLRCLGLYLYQKICSGWCKLKMRI